MNIGRSFAGAERSNPFCFRRPPINTDEDMVQFDFHLSSLCNRALSALRRGVCKSQVDGSSLSPCVAVTLPRYAIWEVYGRSVRIVGHSYNAV